MNSPIIVRFFGSANAKYCGSCGGSRTHGEMASSLFRRLYQMFGDSIKCQFIDVETEELSQFKVLERLKNKRALDLPVVMINDEIQSSGHIYPNRLSHTLKRMLQHT